MSEPSHLDEVALEALANGREDLVDASTLDHVDECAHCAERVALEQSAAEDASLALRRAMPELEDLDAMIAQAMEAAPDPNTTPSRRSLWLGAGFGATIALALGALSIPGPSALGGLGAAGRQLLTLGRALDRVVESSLPGGWIGVALIGLALSLMLVVPTRLLLRSPRPRVGPIVTGALTVGLLGLVCMPSLAHAYRVEGAWPSPMPTVTVDVDGEPTAEALRQATSSAGLGVVVRLPTDQPVTLHVSDAPMDEVFEALLGDLDVVVRPGASLVSVRLDEGSAATPGEDTAGEDTAGGDTAGASPPPLAVAPAVPPTPPPPTLAVPPTPPTPPVPPMVQFAGVGDVVTLGDDVSVDEGQVVRGVYTMGGDADIDGRALGDVVTMGGDASIVGEVIGNVTTMGGDIRVGDGARVHGDLNAMGGEIDIEDGATVHGQVLVNRGGEVHLESDSQAAQHDEGGDRPLAGVFRWGLFNALLFLFGLFMLGTARRRFTALRTELGERPVRSAFGGLFGCLAAVVLAVVLCLTVLGIPGAIVLLILLVVGVGVGWTTTAWWLGGALPFAALKDRPVAQLASGVGILFVFGLVPKVGGLLVVAAVLAGLGSVIATEFGAKKRAPKRVSHVPTGPFRTPS